MPGVTVHTDCLSTKKGRSTKPSNKPSKIILAGLPLLLVLLVSCEKAAGPAQPRGITEVGVVEITSADVPVVSELPGRTSAYRVAEVRPQVGGIISQRLFVEGSEVSEGDPLYQISPEIFLAATNRAEAAQMRAEALLSSARLKADRYAGLITRKMISQEAYDDAQAALREARANVAVAKAELEQARINLQYTVVKAPISGRIGQSFVTDGALVEAEQEGVLAIIRQLDPLYVDLTQSSGELLKLKRQLAAGQFELPGDGKVELSLILDDGSEYVHRGSLQFSEVIVGESTASVTLRAIVPNPDALLLPGLFVRARLAQGLRKAAILAPQQAITFDYSGNAVVLVVGADNKVERRLVKTGRTVADQWLVLEGLQVGERVIVEGLQKVQSGAEVKAVASKIGLSKEA